MLVEWQEGGGGEATRPPTLGRSRSAQRTPRLATHSVIAVSADRPRRSKPCREEPHGKVGSAHPSATPRSRPIRPHLRQEAGRWEAEERAREDQRGTLFIPRFEGKTGGAKGRAEQVLEHLCFLFIGARSAHLAKRASFRHTDNVWGVASHMR